MVGRFIQFIKFCIVGISNTLISYIAYFVFCKVGFHYLLASTIGFILSVVNAFFWNNKYVFTNKTETLIKAFVKMVMSYAFTGFVLSNILLIIWIEGVGVDELVAPIINVVITTPINYLLNKIYAFKDKKEKL